MTNKKKETVTFYNCKNLLCELCKHTYPTNFIIKGRMVELFEMERPSPASNGSGGVYIILEAYGKDCGSVKAVYVISSKPEIKIVSRFSQYLGKRS
jgi:hypothetical protein